MRTYKVIVAYDGTNYHGWQKQNLTAHTVQQVMEDTAAYLLGYSVPLNGSGRTDAGVHARGQCVSMEVAGKLSEDFMERWNALLPEDIKVQSMALVPNGFHARYKAVGKRYSYSVDIGEKPHVFTRKYACHYPKRLDVEAMKKAKEHLVGTHDFTAFTDDKTQRSKVRTIHRITIKEEGSKIVLSFYGTGFLYHMVRILTGTLLCVGDGRLRVQDVEEALRSRDRGRVGFVAPAIGLCLEEVYYEEKNL